MYQKKSKKFSADENNPQYIPYKKGNKKTFWGFTSISLIYNYSFLDGEDFKSGTIFKLLENKEDSMWEYDIGVFNFYGEMK